MNPTEAQLAVAVHENLYALFRAMQAVPGCEMMEIAGMSYHHAFPANPMFRGVWQTRLAAEDLESAIDTTLAWFAERNAPNFFWWTDSHTQPADLGARLLERGFDGNLEGDPGMVAALSTLNTTIRTPEGFAVEQAVDQRALTDWRDVFAAAFEMATAEAQAWLDATRAVGIEQSPWQLYVGYLDGKPVATSLRFNGAGVTGLYAVGVVPGMRRHGIGAAITLQPLLDARRDGYHVGVLFATRMGYPLYARLGFREVADKIGLYMFEP
jgi:GNAT superfamily N-acetyltransferase